MTSAPPDELVTAEGAERPAIPGLRSVHFGPAANALVCALLVVALLAIGLLAGRWPELTAAAAVGGALVGCVAVRPRWAAYVYLSLGPLVVGLERGTVFPLVRVNEILLGAVWLGLILGPLRKWVLMGSGRPKLHSVDFSVIGLAVFSSVTGLMWMYVRGEIITLDDILFALTLWKYLALYALIRITLTSGTHVKQALALVMCSSAVVAVLGILQVAQVGPVPELLSVYIAPGETSEKLLQFNAKSTLGSSIAFADLMSVLAALAVGWLVVVRSRTVVVAAAGVLFAGAALASGQFSGVIGLVTVMLTVGWRLRILKRLLLASLPVAVIGAVLLRPVIEARLLLLDPGTGLPEQWTGQTGRIANLERFFWPRLGEGANWLLGVQTSARVASPEPWRDWVWIESGYTWLLWNGGLPLLIAFFFFVVLSAKACNLAFTHQSDPAFRVAAAAAVAGLAQLTVLMVVDTHLTLRGGADLLFPLVAMAVNGALACGRTGQPAGQGPSQAALKGVDGVGLGVPGAGPNTVASGLV